jgi:6-phosphogluconolactonase
VEERSEARLVVSGGSTPLPFFERLRRRRLPWERVTITLADERWVPTDHPDSNERMVRETLLRDHAVAARWVGLKTDHEDPEAACAECADRIAPLTPFDVVLLGMGSDGHTASLFPGAPSLARGLDLQNEDRCIAVAAAPGRGPRMSLTLAALLDCRRLILHCTGQTKEEVLQRALASPSEAGDPSELPIRTVLYAPQKTVEIYWAP